MPTLACPSCRAPLSLPANGAGLAFRCPHCGRSAHLRASAPVLATAATPAPAPSSAATPASPGMRPDSDTRLAPAPAPRALPPSSFGLVDRAAGRGLVLALAATALLAGTAIGAAAVLLFVQ